MSAGPVGHPAPAHAAGGAVTFACDGMITLPGSGLNGTIPPELGDLFSLQTLDLSGNQLIGGIPISLGDLGQLSICPATG